MANTIITKQKDLPKLAFKTQALAAFAAVAGCNSTVISCDGSGIGTWYSTWRDISSHASSDHSGRTDGRTLCGSSCRSVWSPCKFCAVRNAGSSYASVYDDRAGSLRTGGRSS